MKPGVNARWLGSRRRRMSRVSRHDVAAAAAVDASFASAIAEATKWAAPPLKFSAGDKVQVRYLASSQGSARRPYWHDATVRVADARTGKYDVDFDDGDQESGVTCQHIRARPSKSAEAPATEPQPPIAVPQHAITVHTTAVTEVVELTAAVDPGDGLSEEVEVVAEVDDDDQPLTEVVAEVEDDDDQPLTPDAQISQLPRGALVRLVRDAYASGGISAEAIVAAAAAEPRKFARRLPSERSAARALDPDYEYRGAHSLSAEEALAAAAAEGLELQRASSATGYLGVCVKGASGFSASIRVAGKREHLGTFACAEEAALAYARRRDATRGPPPPPPPRPSVPRADDPLAAQEAWRQAAAEGLELATTAKSSTGFEGVAECRGRDGRMIGRFKAEIKVNGRRESLGTYASAEEAALAVARRRQDFGVEVRQGQKRHRDE